MLDEKSINEKKSEELQDTYGLCRTMLIISFFILRTLII